MIAWSDDDPPAEAVREVVARLVAARSPQRVLLAGQRAAGLVPALPEGTALDVIVRGLPDARDATVTTGLHARARVFCGGLDALDTESAYDLVVALGGPQRLLGPDSVGLDDAALLGQLGDRMAEGGLLVTDIENEVGVHDLVATVPALDPDADDAWHVGAPGFAARHLYRHELEGVLAQAGLTMRAVLCAYPDPTSYRVLVDPRALADPTTRAAATWFVTESVTTHFSTRPSLREPRETASKIVQAGLVEQLAPAWLTISQAGAHGLDRDLPQLPAVLVEERLDDARWARLATVDADGEMRQRWLVGSDPEVTEDALSRDLAAPVIPTGTLLEDALRRACATRSHRELRRLVTAYHLWLTDGAVWTTATAERRVFATPANVAVDGELGLALVDGSWRRAGIVSGTLCFVHGLRDFSMRLLGSASPHPWRSSVTPDELTTTLAAMAGVVVKTGDIGTVSRVGSGIRAIRAGHQESLAATIEADLEAGQWARNLPSPTDAGFRELVMIDRGRARTQREQESQIGWLEGTLRHRDRYIRELERTIERYEETLTYKTVQAIRAPRRIATEKAIESAKSTAREVLPPDAMSKARKLAQRVMRSAG
jgi:hypothetical protein